MNHDGNIIEYIDGNSILCAFRIYSYTDSGIKRLIEIFDG